MRSGSFSYSLVYHRHYLFPSLGKIILSRNGNTCDPVIIKVYVTIKESDIIRY